MDKFINSVKSMGQHIETSSSVPQCPFTDNNLMAMIKNDESTENIEDNSDMFVINIGRTDPCQNADSVYRENESQYMNTDWEEKLLPLPLPPHKKDIAKPKKSGGKKNGKKGGKNGKKK